MARDQVLNLDIHVATSLLSNPYLSLWISVAASLDEPLHVCICHMHPVKYVCRYVP